MEALMKQK